MRKQWFLLLLLAASMHLAARPSDTLPSKAIEKSAIFKTGNIVLKDAKVNHVALRDAGEIPRLEAAMPTAHPARDLQLVTKETLPSRLPVSAWNDAEQRFEAPVMLNCKAGKNGYFIDLRQLGYARRFAVEFPGLKTLTLDRVRILTPDFPGNNWRAFWIWYTRDRVESVTALLRREFELTRVPEKAILQSAADDNGILYVNGKKLSESAGNRNHPGRTDIAPYLKPGKNVIGVKVRQDRYSAGFLGELDLLYPDGSAEQLISDRNWRCLPPGPEPEGWNKPGFDDSHWVPAVELARPPLGDWGVVAYNSAAPKLPLEVLKSDLPETLAAGSQKDCSVQLKLPKLESPLELTCSILREGRTFQSFPVAELPASGGEIKVRIPLNFSRFLMPGTYEISLEAAGCQLVREGKPFRWQCKVLNDRHAKMPIAKMMKHSGGMAVSVNGKVIPFIGTNRGDDQISEHTGMYGKQGVHIYICWMKLQWNEQERPVFSHLDSNAMQALEGDPDALLIIKISLRDSRPGFFTRSHKDDLIVYDNGRRGSNISLASTAWRELAGSNIRAIIEHIKQSPYADHVIGFSPDEGEENQWMHFWGGDDPQQDGTYTDYSPVMLRTFREHLKAKYKTDAALQKAWNNPRVTLETAQIPSRAARAVADGAFRNPVRDVAAIDYAATLSDVVTEGMDFYAKLIKEETKGQSLVGTYYGHIMDLGNRFLGEQTGYLRQKRAVESPWFDFFKGPHHYAANFRDAGGVGSFDAPCPGSLRLHNKMWFNEDDLRSHLTFPAKYAFSVRTVSAFDQVLARQYAKTLCANCGTYFFPLCEGVLNWHDDPETMKTVGELQKIALRHTEADNSERAQIAVFMDDWSISACAQLPGGTTHDRVMNMAIYQREQIGRIGAPYAEYLLDEIRNPALPKYKFYIFLNAYRLDAATETAIREKLKHDNAVALFYYAPGIFAEQGLSAAAANRLLGMQFKLDDTRRSTAWVRDGETIKGREDCAPWLIPSKYDELLGTFSDGTPMFVRKGRNYFAALPRLKPRDLRMIAEKAGVSIFSDCNDAVYHDASLFAIHTGQKGGRHDFTLPEGKWRLVWPAGQEKQICSGKISWRTKSAETRIYEKVSRK